MSDAATEAAAQPGQIGDSPYSIRGRSILLGLLIAVLTIIGFIRSWFATNGKEAQEREDRLMATVEKYQNTMEDRLRTVEVTIRDFMPRVEIDRAIVHPVINSASSGRLILMCRPPLARDATHDCERAAQKMSSG